MAGGVAKLERLTVTVMDDLDVFASASVTLPLVGITAVASMLELLELEVSTTDPGRMNRLKFPIAYARFGIGGLSLSFYVCTPRSEAHLILPPKRFVNNWNALDSYRTNCGFGYPPGQSSRLEVLRGGFYLQ